MNVLVRLSLAAAALFPLRADAQTPRPAPPAPAFAPYVAPIPLGEAAGWNLERVSADQARLFLAGGTAVRLGGLTPASTLDLCAAPSGESAAVLVKHRRFTEILAWQRTPAGLAEVALPFVPAAQILREYPSAGKPKGLVSPRLDGMRVEQIGWGEGRRLAARVRLELVDDSNGSTEWSYSVDALWSLPPPAARGGTPAVLSVVNVVLNRQPAGGGK